MITQVLAAAAEPGENLLPLYYIVGIIGGLLTLVFGSYRLYGKLRDRWINEGQEKTRVSQTNKENTEALAANTVAVKQLADHFAKFSEDTRASLNGHKNLLDNHEGRISHLETYRGT
jgi:hypothetical protein